MGLLKVTVSGDYRTSAKLGSDIVDFEGVVGVMPGCPEAFTAVEDYVRFNVHNRLLQIWIKADARYPQRFEMLKTVYIDKIEHIKGEPSIVGKNIKELSWEELQELACYKNLRNIPAYRATDLRYAREVAYMEYSKHLLGKEIDSDGKDYNFASLPELIVDGGNKAASAPKQKDNEESIAEEQKSTSVEEKTFTMVEFKKLAKEKGIKIPANLSYEKDYAAIVKLVIG